MRVLSTFFSVLALGYGGWWVNTNHPEVKTRVLEFVNSGHFHTLEARYTAKQIMDANRKVLLKDERHKFLEAVTKFTPYVLMQVKYSNSEQTTGEGIILWDMVDGEMVLNTRNWEKTHGFGDCITANVDKSEFKVINILSQRGGILDRDGLTRILQVESDVLEHWIDRCRRKKLVVQAGNNYRLHLQNPRLNVLPETAIDDNLVTKSFKNAERINRRFSKAQIRRIAESAFGNDFAIRNTLNVFLPIYSITVQNPDGSLHTSYWNALNGMQLSFSSVID
ncbi:MAG: hypothetical protein S4CHLAM102_07240 [Chlamydiia bacterium]|nr:hypothetical protein [Chlamydiia bacterium]